MRRIFIMLVTVLAILSVSCNRHNENVKTTSLESTSTYSVTGLDIEQINNLDNEYMTMNFGEHRWLECCIDAEDWMDESDVFNVKGVANIYTVVEMAPDSLSGTMTVHMITHTADTVAYYEEERLWVGDEPMNEFVPFKVDFAAAYDAMMRANCVKPHSRHCVIRREVGENDIEPLYIFGNQDTQVYVSTENGSVTEINPAYNNGDDEFKLNRSLAW